LARVAAGCNRAAEERHLAPGVSRALAVMETTMRGILLWLIGIPIPVIILLYLFNVI
jgi:hypothetical protein